MLIDPPIDQLIKKAECRFALVCAVSRRAKQLLATEGADLKARKIKPISKAAEEIYNDKIIIKKD